MKGTSEVILGVTLIMVATLAVVLALISVLLAELYCSLLLRRRQLRNAIPTATTIPNASPSHTSQPQEQSPPPFTSIYAQGVLQPPISVLLNTISCKQDIAAGPKKQHSELHHQGEQIQTQESNASPCQIGVLSASSPPPSFMSKAPSKPIHQDKDPLPPCSESAGLCPDKPCSGGEHLVYISNPIYENDVSQGSGENTPFETPHTSPSRLEAGGSSGEDDAAQASPCGTRSPPCTPPLTPMKKLAAEACSVSLRDGRSLGNSGSDSHSNNGLSSSSSATPCTSPSW